LEDRELQLCVYTDTKGGSASVFGLR